MTNLQKSKYLLRNLVINQKCTQKIAQIATNFTFLKSPRPSEFKSAKTFENFLKSKCVLKKN